MRSKNQPAKNAKKTNPLVWVALGTVAIAAYVMTAPSDTPHTVPRKVTPKATAKNATFLPEDYKAKFPDVAERPKNVFMPIVMKTVTPTATGPGGPVAPTGVPNDFANGEAGWTYTGTVEVNGVTQAVLENRQTGEGAFVKIGETWKHATVVGIGSTAIELRGPSGQTAKVMMQGTLEAAPPAAGGLAPLKVQPPLRGAIGPLTVTPDQGAQTPPPGRNPRVQAIQDGDQ